ncbi:methyltransferase, FxLD system [Promicromonospora sp. NPDC023805]|uniref:methyltransferase, FxLD system n=1 Tax=Promicromonospora sp. NPDC023805 TaxID=3154696 RepID=UPI00340BBA5B
MGAAASLEGPLPGRIVSTRQDADPEGATVTEQSSMTAEEKAAGLREQMVQYLVEHGDARTPSVVAALRKVPRHLVAGADPERAYSPEKALVTKRSADGVGLSSVSAARVQAMQLEQADLLAGMRVLEVGSGGVNAAYIAELVGPSGKVVTVDIDEDVTDRAHQFLSAAGYEDVVVVTGDAEHGVPAHAPYDRIVVTVETSDIPPAWREQLTPDGVIVAPIRVRGLTRTVALVRDGESLVSRSMDVCGFVPMRGEGASAVDVVVLHDDAGQGVGLRIDGPEVFDDQALREALHDWRAEQWSGVMVGGTESLEYLDLWLTTALDPMPLLAAEPGAKVAGLVAAASPLGIPALVDGDSFAYRKARPTEEADRFELGVIAHGPHAEQVAARYAEQIVTWDAEHRSDRPRLTVAPAGSQVAEDSPSSRTVDRRHSRLTITWP